MTSLDVGVNILKSGNKTSVVTLGVDNASIASDVPGVVPRLVGEIPIPKDGTTVGACGCAVGSSVGVATVVSGCICDIPGETVTE